ncbi:MAG: amidohydrolase family protein [Desulfurivibrionaceae bacterium]|jgi:imidazolonepropionase-like amidohydrolase|nr:amidohydrolase family protein [Desulfurivibrionaceae bacterium]
MIFWAGRSLCLINCHVFDGELNSSVLHGTTITVQFDDDGIGRIAAIGDNPSSRDVVMDLGGSTVLPGLINAHCHIFNDGGLRPLGDEVYFRSIRRWPARSLFLRKIAVNLRSALHAGVTTVRCLGEPHSFDLLIRTQLKKRNAVAPRIIAAGTGICITGGHAAAISRVADSPWDVRQAVRQGIREGNDLIKIFSTGGVADSRRKGEAGRLQMTPDEIAAACDEAHRAGLMVASHAQSPKGVLEALTGGVDTIEHGAELSVETVALFLNNEKALHGQSALIPTLSPVLHLCGIDPHVTKLPAQMLENITYVRDGMIVGLRAAKSAGIKIGIGNDASMPAVTHYDFWRELLYISAIGAFTPQETIHLATAGNAELLGIGHLTGRIAPGLSADLVAFKDNPTVDLRALSRPAFVMMEGHFIAEPRVTARIEAVDEALRTIDVIAAVV